LSGFYGIPTGLGKWVIWYLDKIKSIPRPSADRTVKNEKTRLKLGQIGPLKKTKYGFDRPVDRSVELGWAFVINKASMGVGFVAEGRRQRDARDCQNRVIRKA
jgi:hypothetical protein